MVAQSESTLSLLKAKLGMIEHGHLMNGWLLHARLCSHFSFFSGVKNYVQTQSEILNNRAVDVVLQNSDFNAQG